MINLKLKSDCKFSSCSHLGIFYAVVDVYQNRGSAVNDSEMVQILKDQYGLEVERRTIKRYRDFLSENFDINLKYFKKGYYIQTKSDNELEIEKKVKTILDTIDTLSGTLGISIKYENEDMAIIPLEINYINDSPYLLCLKDSFGNGIDLKNFLVSKITFNAPLVVDCGISIPYSHEYLEYGCFSWERNLETIPYEEPYKISATIVFKKDAPIKELRRIIKNNFKYDRSKNIVINGESYRSTTFEGDSLEVASFVVRNRRFLIKIIGQSILEEIRMMFGL